MPIYVPGKLVLSKGYTQGDPFFSNVSLLLRGDGTNGSQTITDSSPSPKTVTAIQNAQINTTVTDPFGRTGFGVLAFNANGDCLAVTNNNALSLESFDFTVETWVYRTTSDANQIAMKRVGGTGWLWAINANNTINFSFIGVANSSVTSTATVPSSQWVHLAATKTGSTCRQFINGTLDTTTAATFGAEITNTSNLFLASFGGLSNFLNGYMDEFRITKGVSRYVEGTGANAGKMVFTGTNTLALPTAPFIAAQY